MTSALHGCRPQRPRPSVRKPPSQGHGAVDMTKGDVEECQMMVEEFHTHVATFRELVISIGDASSDSLAGRLQLRRSRGQCSSMATDTCTSMAALNRPEEGEIQYDIYRLYIQFHGCLEMYISEMLKSICLMESFQLQGKGREARGTPVSGQRGAQDASHTPILDENAASQTPNLAEIGWTTPMEIHNTQRDLREMKALLSKLRESMPLPLKNQDDSALLSLIPSYPPLRRRKRKLLRLCCLLAS
ncbi:regulator of G-protein signaling 7-binding protein isoform X2 [Lethenteron reissneri]|uniref:regulator of G-protein signaling 7-binding protein isoform X2 n=1 Tax=Lethenteron reissneri TaxID=7753 RepID=UPI002AB67E24|nr:regulator of G-protein signaling 7-binding protein isoform X2 [Lethenteron reissneri]